MWGGAGAPESFPGAFVRPARATHPPQLCPQRPCSVSASVSCCTQLGAPWPHTCDKPTPWRFTGEPTPRASPAPSAWEGGAYPGRGLLPHGAGNGGLPSSGGQKGRGLLPHGAGNGGRPSSGGQKGRGLLPHGARNEGCPLSGVRSAHGADPNPIAVMGKVSLDSSGCWIGPRPQPLLARGCCQAPQIRPFEVNGVPTERDQAHGWGWGSPSARLKAPWHPCAAPPGPRAQRGVCVGRAQSPYSPRPVCVHSPAAPDLALLLC
ncbi:unnamed protein product [Lepidochelys kempii]